MQLSIVWKLSLIPKKLGLSSNLDIFSWMSRWHRSFMGSVFGCQTDTSELQITEVMIRIRQEIIILITWFLLLGEAPSGDFALEVTEHSNCVPHHCAAKRLQAWCDNSYAEMTYLSVSVMSVWRDRDRRNVELPNWCSGYTLKRWRCVSLYSLYVVQGIDSRKLLCKSSNKEIRCHQRFLLTSTVRSRLIVRTPQIFRQQMQKLCILECMTRFTAAADQRS